MTHWQHRVGTVLVFLCMSVVAGRPIGAQVEAEPDTTAEQDRTALAHRLPHMDGGHLEVTVVEVTYGPGGGSAPHSHPCPVVGYVVEGALRTKVQGEPAHTYTTGQSFYERPNGAHVVSRNASRDKPVRFLAYFMCDHQTPLSVAVPASTGGQ